MFALMRIMEQNKIRDHSKCYYKNETNTIATLKRRHQIYIKIQFQKDTLFSYCRDRKEQTSK